MNIERDQQELITLQQTSDEPRLSRLDIMSGVAGIAIIVLTILAFMYMPTFPNRFKGVMDESYKRAFLQLHIILGGVFCSAFLLTPALNLSLNLSLNRLRGKWRNIFTYGALVSTCVFCCWFILHFGRDQFGAWDYNILIDTGWRQISGQRPYVDFPATTPAGFNLGIRDAFYFFGASWDANLYLTAGFTCATFVWLYWLMRRLSMGRLASIAVSFAIESATTLALCFWWYNNTTLVCTTVFFLSCLAYVMHPRSWSVQLSYTGSLAVLALMKPNVAGLTMLGCVLLLFFITESKVRLVFLTALAGCVALVLLRLHHVPIKEMFESYISVARERGGIRERFAFRQSHKFQQHAAELWIFCMALPLLGLVPRVYTQIRQRDGRGLGLSSLLAFSLAITLYGLLTNAEFRDLECAVLMAAIGVISFGLRWNGTWLRRFTTAIVCASIACDLTFGAERLRVYDIGAHLFFEWQDNQHPIDRGFLRHMRVSRPMLRVQAEVEQAVRANPGSYFFGPRLEYEYAVCKLTSPAGYPTYWQPGTAFGSAESSRLLGTWRQHHFETLVFMRPGFYDYDFGMFYSFYPKGFLDAINESYISDDRYPDLVVYHLREAAR